MPIGLGYAGLAKESTFGTAAVVSTFIPVKSIEPGQDPQNYYPEQIRSSRSKHQGIGMGIKNELSVEMDAEPQSIGHLLLAAMGSVASTQPNAATAATVYQHVFTPGNVLPSYTWEKYDTTMIQTVAGAKADSLTLSIEAGSDGVLTAEMDWVAKSIADKAGASTPNYSDKTPFVFHRTTVKRGATTTDNIKSLEIEISNNLKDDQFYLNGSREVGSIEEGIREVTISGELKFKDKAHYTAFANGDKEAITVTFEGLTIGTTTYKDKLDIELPSCLYDSFEVPMGGADDEVTASFEATALVDTTKGYEVKATLVNTMVSY